jgi:hypothetical protein
MVGIGLANGQDSTATQLARGVPQMTLGATSTETTPLAVVATSFASPTLKAKPK